MDKTIRKLRPRNNWCIGELESWFSDMAKKGLHLKKVGRIFTYFVPSEPKEMKYRIDVNRSNEKMTLDQRELYEESGWDYVTSYGDFHVFSSPVSLNAPELHTDPVEQSYTLKYLDKKFLLYALVSTLAFFIMSYLLIYLWIIEPTPALALIEGRSIQQLILFIVFLFMAYESVRGAITIRKLRGILAGGKPINHNVPWKRTHRVSLAINIIWIILILFGSIIPFIQIAVREEKTMPETDINLPIVRLKDVEKNPALVRGIPYKYEFNWSLLAPVQYNSLENGSVPADNGSEPQQVGINTWVCKLIFPSMKKNIISDLMEKYLNDNNHENLTKMNHANFDTLIVYEKEGVKEVFASKGKWVMYVGYRGNDGELDTILKNMAEKMTILNK